MTSGGGASLGFGVAPDPATQRAIEEYPKQHPPTAPSTGQDPLTDQNAVQQKSAEGGVVVRHRDGGILMSSGGGSSLGFGVAPDPATQRAIEEYLRTHPQDAVKDGNKQTPSRTG
jgi:hypothetical protein